jgi:hypothetical protein
MLLNYAEPQGCDIAMPFKITLLDTDVQDVARWYLKP